MKRKDFINMAVLLAIGNRLHMGKTEGEIFRFDQSFLGPLLKNVSRADKEMAVLLARNLLFDIEYIFKNSKDLKDISVLKRVAMEADKNFYLENKLSTGGFQYQPINFSALEEIRKKTTGDSKGFDLAIRTLKENINKLKTTGSDFAKIIPEIYKNCETAAQAAAAAQEGQNCAKTVQAIFVVIVAVIIAVIAVITSYCSGCTNPPLQQIVAAGLAAVNNFYLGPQIITIGRDHITLDNTKIAIDPTKVNFEKVDLDRMLKCSVSAFSTATVMSIFGKSEYPSNAIAGSLAINLVAITAKLPEIETVCW